MVSSVWLCSWTKRRKCLFISSILLTPSCTKPWVLEITASSKGWLSLEIYKHFILFTCIIKIDVKKIPYEIIQAYGINFHCIYPWIFLSWCQFYREWTNFLDSTLCQYGFLIPYQHSLKLKTLKLNLSHNLIRSNLILRIYRYFDLIWSTPDTSTWSNPLHQVTVI